MSKRVKSKRTESKPEVYDDVHQLELGLRIDQNALEVALQEQPELFHRVSKALAVEISLRDEAKQLLAETEAEVDLSIRKENHKKEIKMSEAEIAANKRMDSDVKADATTYLNLCKTTNKLIVLKESFQQRSYALKELVSLYVANYYTASEHSATNSSLRNRQATENRQTMHDARRRSSDKYE